MFRRVPRKLEQVLGDEGANEFVDFINDSFAANKENVMELVFERFEKRLAEELNAFRAEYKQDLADLRAEFKAEIAELRMEMHKLMATQTRWVLGAIIAMTGIFSIIVKL
ncbi:LA_3696 family protein [Leptospira sp. SA-E8]|uniref:LA_3696 family protein n=1 Tax=Leptospira sp. SA-E8 TaxID=3422259 RepID=UPI003EBEA5AB